MRGLSSGVVLALGLFLLTGAAPELVVDLNPAPWTSERVLLNGAIELGDGRVVLSIERDDRNGPLSELTLYDLGDGALRALGSLGDVRFESARGSFDGAHFFDASTTEHGRELWRLDGALMNVALTGEAAAGEDASNPSPLTIFGGAAYFLAYQPALGLTSLMRIESATSAPVKVIDVSDGVRALVAAGDRLVFAVRNALYTSDGTALGTHRVELGRRDLLDCCTLAPDGVSILFWARELGETKLYRLGRDDQLEQLLFPADHIDSFSSMLGRAPLLFVAQLAGASILYRSDGSLAGTLPIALDAADLHPLFSSGDRAWFSARDNRLLSFDRGTLTSSKTIDVDLELSSATVRPHGAGMIYAGSSLDGQSWRMYFDDGASITERWSSGAERDQVLLDRLLVVVEGEQRGLYELDDRARPSFLSSFEYSGTESSEPRMLAASPAQALFSATEQDGLRGVFITDGDRVSRIADGDAVVGAAAGEHFFWIEATSAGEHRLWRSDPPELIAGLGAPNFLPELSAAGDSVLIGGSGLGPGLYASDGTPGALIDLMASIDRRDARVLDHLALGATGLAAISIVVGDLPELWIADVHGIEAATRLEVAVSPFASIYFLRPGPEGSFYFLRDADDHLVYRVDPPYRELTLVTELSAKPQAMELAGEHLVAGAVSGLTAELLFRGPNGETDDVALSDFGLTRAYDFVASDGRVYFLGEGFDHGREVWSTDGTREGTRIARDLMPGRPDALRRGVNAKLYANEDGVLFAANDGVHGRELWTSDGSEAGTRLIAEVAEGRTSGFTRAGAPDSAPVVVGSWILFPGYRPETGVELWRVSKDEAPAPDPLVDPPPLALAEACGCRETSRGRWSIAAMLVLLAVAWISRRF